jgi:hypothetical protein
MVKPPDFHSGNYGFEPRRPYCSFPPAHAGGSDWANAEMTTFIETEKPCHFIFLSPKILETWRNGSRNALLTRRDKFP